MTVQDDVTKIESALRGDAAAAGTKATGWFSRNKSAVYYTLGAVAGLLVLWHYL